MKTPSRISRPSFSKTILSAALFALACDRGAAAERPPQPRHAAAASETKLPAGSAPQAHSPAPASQAPKDPANAAMGPAKLGQPAPGFALQDLTGREVSLESFLGKTVVLEWFNPGCPFVVASHRKGSLASAAAKAQADGVVWLAINSGAPGKQGHGIEVNRAAQLDFELEHPILLDELGVVGRAYGAERTPHLFIIDQQGTLVYAGAPDNSPDGEKASPEGGKLIPYLAQALSELAAGQPVSIPRTKAYGCSVKYGS